jgi:hypothetical protein
VAGSRRERPVSMQAAQCTHSSSTAGLRARVKNTLSSGEAFAVHTASRWGNSAGNCALRLRKVPVRLAQTSSCGVASRVMRPPHPRPSAADAGQGSRTRAVGARTLGPAAPAPAWSSAA